MRGLTAEQQEARSGKLTGSMVGALMSGDPDKILHLWRIMVGEEEEPDLSKVWPVQLGAATEQLNLDWFELKTGHPVTKRGAFVVHPFEHWMGCTLDGWDDVLSVPIEAKHVGGFEEPDVVLQRYQPQLHWTMLCTRTTSIRFSVIYRASEPAVETIHLHQPYADGLLKRAKEFMVYVDTFTPPVVMPRVEAPVLPTITVDMTATKLSNQWGDAAARWLENIPSAIRADEAEKELKGLCPVEAREAHGAGVKITKDKKGRMSLRASKS
jgi:hypothetical protein